MILEVEAQDGEENKQNVNRRDAEENLRVIVSFTFVRNFMRK